jgi:hypothetical protein
MCIEESYTFGMANLFEALFIRLQTWFAAALR